MQKNMKECPKCKMECNEDSEVCAWCHTSFSGDTDDQVRQEPDHGIRAPVPVTPGNAVVVTDFDMPFESMVKFMVKWAFAAIPAAIILFIVFAILGAIFGGIIGSMF